MEKYIKVYSFEVMKRLEEGKAVYMLDKRLNDVFCVNSLSIERVMNVLRAIDEADRYDFWYIEVVGEANGML